MNKQVYYWCTVIVIVIVVIIGFLTVSSNGDRGHMGSGTSTNYEAQQIVVNKDEENYLINDLADQSGAMNKMMGL